MLLDMLSPLIHTQSEGSQTCIIGLPPVFVPTSELVKTVRWHPPSFLGLATW